MDPLTQNILDPYYQQIIAFLSGASEYNFAEGNSRCGAACIIPFSLVLPHGRAVLASAAVVRLPYIPIGEVRCLPRRLPDVGTLGGIVIGPEPNDTVFGLRNRRVIAKYVRQ